jgi:hypothetical protein
MVGNAARRAGDRDPLQEAAGRAVGGKPTKRNGSPCGRLAMTRYGVSVCGSAMPVIVGLAMLS